MTIADGRTLANPQSAIHNPQSTMACYLGLDYGGKRIGLAVGDTHLSVASPLVTVAARGQVGEDVRAVLECARDYQIEAFVVGLPLNMDGSEGEQAKLTRRFGEALAHVTGLPVHYWDERLSTAEARELLRPAELTRKKRKARLDRVAAQVILQNFLDSHTKEQSK